MRSLKEKVKKAICYQKLFWPFTVWINCFSELKIFANSRLKAENFKRFSRSLEQFFLPVGQNNFGNKIPHLPAFLRIKNTDWIGWHLASWWFSLDRSNLKRIFFLCSFFFGLDHRIIQTAKAQARWYILGIVGICPFLLFTYILTIPINKGQIMPIPTWFWNVHRA